MRQHSILKSTVLFAIFGVLIKLIGFAREAVIASYYGANANTDAFFFAHSIPQSIFPSVCVSISTAFVSLYVKKQVDEGVDASTRYASGVIIATTLLGIALSIFGVLISPIVVPILAPGFKGEQLELAIRLSKIVMSSFFLIMMQYMLGAVLQSNKLFYPGQIGGVLYNTVILVSTLLLGHLASMDILTISVVAGLLVYVILLWFFSKKFLSCRIFREFQKEKVYQEFKQLFKLAIPIILGNTIVQLNSIVDKAIGSVLPSGSLSSLAYAETINSIIYAVFVTSLSTVIYPSLVESATKKDHSTFSKNIVNGISILSMILLFISVVVLSNAREIIQIVFERGNFTSENTEMTAVIVAIYAGMYVFLGIREILTRALFSIQNTKSPMINSSIGVACNIVLSIIFSKIFGVLGIALGTTISSALIAIMMIVTVKKKIKEIPISDLIRSVGKQIFAAGISYAIIYFINHLIPINTSIVKLFIDSILILIFYITILFMMKSKEISYVFLMGRNYVEKKLIRKWKKCN